jgi:hypothetical protein
MKYNLIIAKSGDVIQIYSDLWYYFDGTVWKEMNIEQQLQFSEQK